jgi:hypothetical protein
MIFIHVPLFHREGLSIGTNPILAAPTSIVDKELHDTLLKRKSERD